MSETERSARVREILVAIKPLAAEFYRLTGKPLGVTGEVAEYVAADLLGLELAPARQAGYDAIRRAAGRQERVQIKGRAYAKGKDSGQRLGTIKPNAECDVVLLVLMDNATLEPREILEADYSHLCDLLTRPGKARERGSLSVAEFRRVAKVVWSDRGASGAATPGAR
ncbi:DUF6998 domain-containing protein [Methylobacterium fujisawaense]|uniref:DUF6998 domain-containing protein n=1 Tax=Methylobacterium fujisawaense TaxID=107400 RepID=UPI002449706C|nr:hypothetical protein [Methylobacterium fujisawaense]MDH3032108.1 hypothetical protein [Methylobacterium fujisawaense]